MREKPPIPHEHRMWECVPPAHPGEIESLVERGLPNLEAHERSRLHALIGDQYLGLQNALTDDERHALWERQQKEQKFEEDGNKRAEEYRMSLIKPSHFS